MLTDSMERPLTQTCFLAPWQSQLLPLRCVFAVNIDLDPLGASAVQILIVLLLAPRRFNFGVASLGASAVQLLIVLLLASWRFNFDVASSGVLAVQIPDLA